MFKLNLKKAKLLFLIFWYLFLLSPFFAHPQQTFRSFFDLDIEYLSRLNSMTIYVQMLLFLLSISFLAILVLKKKIAGFRLEIAGILYGPLAGSLLYLVVGNYLLNLESKKYPNFLYSQTGFTPEQIRLVLLFCTLFILITIPYLAYSYLQEHSKERVRVRGVNTGLVIFVILLLTQLSAYPFFSFTKMYAGAKVSYSEILGNQYPYIRALEDNTPKNSNVIHPPQGSKWPAIGNQVVLRYFLFPRTLISGAVLNNEDLAIQIGSAYFVSIEPGTKYQWPLISQDAIIFNEKDSINFKAMNLVSEENGIKIFQIFFR